MGTELWCEHDEPFGFATKSLIVKRVSCVASVH
jgi:hypothetical protein